MPFDEPGQQGSAFEIQDDCPGRNPYRTRGSRSLDKPAMDKDLPAIMHLLAVEDPVGPQ
jgi:hypothetical protein